MLYDIIIVGGGIAGLYCGYILQKTYPTINFIILEKQKCTDNTKTVVAGRICSSYFMNHRIQLGAGIAIKTNKLLLKLLKELNIPYAKGYVKQKMPNNHSLNNFQKIVNKLKYNYNKTYNDNISGLTFKQFALQYISTKEYDEFMADSGYRDFEKADCYHILNYYDLGDNVNDFDCIYCDWSTMIKKLHLILKDNIVYNCSVNKFIHKNEFTVKTNKNIYYTKNIICATAIDGIKQLFSNKIYNNIIGLSELRIYGSIRDETRDTFNTYLDKYQVVKTTNILQKIISIDKNNGLYMLAYCDTKNADILHKHMNNKKYITCLIKQATDIDINISNMKNVYWDISVHCYKPLKKNYGTIDNFINILQHPAPNILIVGEAVAHQHGWIESALHSVHITLNKFMKVSL